MDNKLDLVVYGYIHEFEKKQNKIEIPKVIITILKKYCKNVLENMFKFSILFNMVLIKPFQF